MFWPNLILVLSKGFTFYLFIYFHYICTTYFLHVTTTCNTPNLIFWSLSTLFTTFFMRDNAWTLLQTNDNVCFITFLSKTNSRIKQNSMKLGKGIRKKNSAPKLRLTEQKRIESNLANMYRQRWCYSLLFYKSLMWLLNFFSVEDIRFLDLLILGILSKFVHLPLIYLK